VTEFSAPTGVGEVEEGVDDILMAFVAALQPVEGVVPGVGPLDVPALPGLDGGLVALAGDFAGQAAAGELVAGLLRVIPGVEVDGDVIRERADVVEFVQRGSQQRGVVPVCRGEHPAERDAAPLDQQRPFHALFAAVDRAGAGAVPAAGSLGDAPVDGDVGQGQADDPVIGLPRDLLQRAEDPGLDPFVAAVPDRGGTAGAVGDRRVRAAEPQDLDELFEDDPVGDPRLVAAQRV
jgi:hypothetical protein